MSIDPRIRETYRRLSPTAAHFLDYLDEKGEDGSTPPPEPQGVPPWLRFYSTRLQHEPIFVGPERLDEIRKATLGVTELIRSVPERFFDNDPDRIATYYDVPNSFLMALVLEPPNGLRSGFVRCDFVDSTSGFKCLEVNTSAALGGWQGRFYKHVIFQSPLISEFMRQEGVSPSHRDPWRNLFDHVVSEALERGVATERLDILVVVDDHVAENEELDDRAFNEAYGTVIEDSETLREGRVTLIGTSELPSRIGQGASGTLELDGRRIHAVIEYQSRAETVPEIFRSFKMDRLCLFNGPLGDFLGDKRNLALLSMHADSDLFNDEERGLIRNHLPWTRSTDEEEVTFEGYEFPLRELLQEHRERFVLKPGAGAHGEGVTIGRCTDPAAWDEAVRVAVEDGTWVAQECLESRPYLFRGEHLFVPHQAVWGTFVYGGQYGGGFIRAKPESAEDAVVNSARGASVGVVLEV